MTVLDLSRLARPPLSSSLLIRTSHVSELERAVSDAYPNTHVRVVDERHKLNAITNHVGYQGVSLTYAAHGARVQITNPAAEFFGQLFALKGSAQAKFRADSIPIVGDETFVASHGLPFDFSYSSSFEKLVLRIDAKSLEQKLKILIDDGNLKRLQFMPASNMARAEAKPLKKLLQRFVEISEANTPQSETVLAELEQAILVAFLFSNRHSYSQLLDSEPLCAGPWQVRRAEAYIEANWSEPLSLEGIAGACNTSIRSLFHTFKQSREYSPMEFLRRVRLAHARGLLTNPSQETRITDVAMACGFANVGHFARYYRRRFNELPSETLDRSKSGVNRQTSK